MYKVYRLEVRRIKSTVVNYSSDIADKVEQYIRVYEVLEEYEVYEVYEVYEEYEGYEEYGVQSSAVQQRSGGIWLQKSVWSLVYYCTRVFGAQSITVLYSI